jgi:N-acetylmuramoyl-L-alanine amidase
MRSAILTSITLLAVLALLPVSTAAQETATVSYDDGRPPESVLVSRADPESEMLYLRANDVARIFKATQFWNATNRKTVLGIGGSRFTVTVDTRVVVIDGEPVMLKTPVLYEEGFVMIPMEFVLEIAPPHTMSELAWDAGARKLSVRRVGYNVTGLDFTITPDRSTATIELGEPLIHHVESSTPGLVRLKIYGGRADEGKFTVKEAHGMFNEVRAEQTDRDLFLYFDVKRYVERVLVEREDSPPRVRVVLEKGQLPEIPEPDFAGRKRVEIVDRRTAEPRRLEIGTVVLDPGHGGKDYGKVGVTGVLEKDVNLAIARKIRDGLARDLGLNVVMTREDDQLLSLTQRTEIANEVDGDLFISIHCNGWFSAETGGFEAYFLSPARTEWDRSVAMAENAADDFLDVKSDAASDIEFILWDVVQNEFIKESSLFAEMVQKTMSDGVDIRNRGVKQANFTVLQGARMPAVLIEIAFLSNPTEEKLLEDPGFQDEVAGAVVQAVQRLRDRYRR